MPYEVFVAPGLLAAAAMNGAIFDSTFNFFVKFKYFKTYDAILASPLSPADAAAGEILWSLIRGVAYSAVFLLTMAVLGYTESWWALAALPTDGADRRRVRIGGPGRHHVHAVVRRLRLRQPGHHPVVPVLGDLLPARRAIPMACSSSSS